MKKIKSSLLGSIFIEHFSFSLENSTQASQISHLRGSIDILLFFIVIAFLGHTLTHSLQPSQSLI